VWVCHFLPWPATGFGALQRTHHLVRQLAAHFDVHLVVAARQPGGTEELLGMGVRSAEVVPVTGRTRALVSAARGVLGPATYWERLWDAPSLRAAVARAAARVGGQRAILLLDTSFLAPLADAAPGLPVVVTHHNVESDLLRQRAAVEGGARGRFFARQATLTERLERRLTRQVALNLVVSPDDAVRFRALAGDVPIEVVPNGVDVEYFAPMPEVPVTPHSLVFAGGMDWFPNRDAMVWLARELWPALVAREPRRTLTVLGKSAPEELLELGRRDARVRVLGFVPYVRPYLADASAYLCPIRIGGGTRLKVLDALAMGVPLVATSLSVEGLGLERGHHYLRADQVDDFVTQLEVIDTDADLGRAIGASGRRFVAERFGWQTIGNRLSGAIHRCGIGGMAPLEA
jgi:glycosyltransferase involved in cell wall biosynthesis